MAGNIARTIKRGIGHKSQAGHWSQFDGSHAPRPFSIKQTAPHACPESAPPHKTAGVMAHMQGRAKPDGLALTGKEEGPPERPPLLTCHFPYGIGAGMGPT